jgi:rubrerythrin
LVDDTSVCGYEKHELPVRCPYCGRTKLRFWKPIL